MTYRAAWFMAHRLRYAMDHEPDWRRSFPAPWKLDEGYIGGKRKGGRGRRPADGGRKAAVAVLVERGGNVRAMPMQRIDGASMEREIRNYVASGSRLMTDETNIYQRHQRERESADRRHGAADGESWHGRIRAR